MSKRTHRRDQIAAHHEAGHAIARIVLGEDFDYVTIQPDDECAGHVASTRPDDVFESWNNGDRLYNPRVTQYVEHEVIDTLAGSEAQRLFFPRCHWRAGHGLVKNLNRGLGGGNQWMADGSDMQKVHRLLYDLHSGDFDIVREHYVYLATRARSLVKVHRERIARVAEALMENRTLSADAVRAVAWPELRELRESLRGAA